jgi:hypothetical protein
LFGFPATERHSCLDVFQNLFGREMKPSWKSQSG